MTKEEIKDLYSMKDILKRYGLQQPNRAGFIRCPFHNERTASMKIYPKDFHCFGCGAHGDIFTFVQLMDGISFKEAFKGLGGDSDNSFSTRLKIYQAQKKREMEVLQKEKSRMCLRHVSALIEAYRFGIEHAEPLSDTWCECYNRMQYQMYVYEELCGKEARD